MSEIDQSANIKKAYSEGFQKGSCGMAASFLPPEYIKNLDLKGAWLKGWSVGQKKSGLRRTNSSLWRWPIILVSIIAIVFYLNHQFSNKTETRSADDKLYEHPTQPSFSDSTSNTFSGSTSNTFSDSTSDALSFAASPSFDVADAVLENKTLPTPAAYTSPEKNSTPETSETLNDSSFNRELELSPINEAENANIFRLTFAKNIVAREPVDKINGEIEYLDNVFFFTEVRGFIGRKVSHQWYHESELISTIVFDEIKGKRWRLYSSHLIGNRYGSWTVKIYDESEQKLILERHLKILPPKSVPEDEQDRN